MIAPAIERKRRSIHSVPKTRRRSRPAPRRGCMGGLFVSAVKLAFVLALVWAVAALGLYAWALTYDLGEIFRMPQRSSVFDKDGRFFSRLAGENRVLAPFDRVSNHFVNALLAREDTRFYRHHGIDPIGIGRAVVRNFIAGGLREGASTITQQLARNSFALGGRTFQRKLLEAALAYRIETELTKEQILEAYMNRIYFGSGFYGIEAASQAYFGKPASRLDLGESAMLAGLIRSPNRFSPFRSLEKSLRERNVVLERMQAVGLITSGQLAVALASKPRIAPPPRSTPQENWAMTAIVEELELVLDRAALDAGGLRIETTIDPALQAAAERSVPVRLAAIEARPGFPHPRKAAFAGQEFTGVEGTPFLEAAVIALDSGNGGIRAIVGSRDLGASAYNRAFHARRQAGSTAKPFVYAAALERGLKPRERISDARLRPGEMPPGHAPYDPANADGTYGGDLPAEEGLVHSRNTMSIRVGLRAGLDAVAGAIIRAGIAADPPRYPSVCLGAFESNLKDLTAAYTAFSNDGIRAQPYIIEKVTDARGNLLYRATRAGLRVLPARAASLTAEMLEEVVERGTASPARRMGLRGRAGGKTGTTDDSRDAWFLGFAGPLTCGVWVGFDQPKPILPGGSGADLALPIWVDVMTAAQ